MLPRKLGVIKTFSREAIATWVKANLLRGCDVRDGLACFAGVIEADCAQQYIFVGSCKQDTRAATAHLGGHRAGQPEGNGGRRT